VYKKIFEDFDKIQVPQKVVDDSVKLALDETQATECIHHYTFRKRRIFMPLAAACMLAVFAGTLCFGLIGEGVKNRSTVINEGSDYQNRYSFTVRAKAGRADDATLIDVNSTEVTGGWAMYENFEKYKDFSPNYFQSYVLTEFNIEGDNIKSVSLKTEKEGVYFAISPAGYYINANDEIARQKVKEAAENYSDFSLKNSQYTYRELQEYSDGLSFGDIYCDTFNYTNNSGAEKISFSRKVELVIESNHENEQVSDKLDRIWQCEQELLEIRAQHTFEGGELTDREEELYGKMERLSQEIKKLVLNDAVIIVMVEFEDGTIQEKSLKLGLEVSEEYGMWLTISE